MKQYNIVSFGSGMQSTVMYRMGCLELIKPKPDFAIFADTGWERDGTYENLKICQEFGEKHGVPIHVVKRGNIRKETLDTSQASGSMPFFVKKEDGKAGMLNRQCTDLYKLKPIRDFVKEKIKPNRKNPVVMWIGISTDEALRMKKSNVQYQILRYPLAMELRMSRQDCINWLKDNNFHVPVRSACIGCPFHDEREWNNLTESEFKDACDFDETVRKQGISHPKLGNGYLKNRIYLDRSLIPLKERPFNTNTELQLDLFETKDTDCDEGGCFL